MFAFLKIKLRLRLILDSLGTELNHCTEEAIIYTYRLIKTFLACGFWDPNPNDLKRIRQELEYDANEFRDIINAKDFSLVWGALEGSELKTAPRNFDKNHPDIDLIRKKQYIFSINFSNKEVCEPKFINRLEDALKKVRPFTDYMSDLLTTDENGESLF